VDEEAAVVTYLGLGFNAPPLTSRRYSSPGMRHLPDSGSSSFDTFSTKSEYNRLLHEKTAANGQSEARKKETKMDVLSRLKSEVGPESRRREAEKFSQWLQLGGLSKPDTATSEGLAAWSRINELYEFCEWVKEHEARLNEVSLSGIVAVAGPDERRFEPDGGLTPDHWPYIKAVLVPEDDDSANTDRCETIKGILKNQVRRRGRSVFAAFSAVQDFAIKADELGFALWSAVEESTFEKVIEDLDERAAVIDQDLQEHIKRVLRANSLSVTDAAKIIRVDVGTMSRARDRFDLAASDGVRIDGLKFIKWAPTYEPQRRATRPLVAKVQPTPPEDVADAQDKMPSAREAIFFYLQRTKHGATKEQIIEHCREWYPKLPAEEIDSDLGNPFYEKTEVDGKTSYTVRNTLD
jgi:hypothetical protein